MRILLATAPLLVALLHPTLASAGWGDEKWGEMIWGGHLVPSMSIEGWIALAVLLMVVPSKLLAKRHRSARP